MASINNLICWKELNNTCKWEMLKQKDVNAFLLNLLYDENVNNHTIFIIPVNAIFSGIWLMPDTHKSNRVNFNKFFEDIGTVYAPPKVKGEHKPIIEKVNEVTKYGWISPDGRYFHCDYQGHSDLAYRICFGMVDTDNSERYLEDHGWCKIYKSLFSEKYSVYVGGRFVITKEQMDRLLELGIEDMDNLSDMLCKD